MKFKKPGKIESRTAMSIVQPKPNPGYQIYDIPYTYSEKCDLIN